MFIRFKNTKAHPLGLAFILLIVLIGRNPIFAAMFFTVCGMAIYGRMFWLTHRPLAPVKEKAAAPAKTSTSGFTVNQRTAIDAMSSRAMGLSRSEAERLLRLVLAKNPTLDNVGALVSEMLREHNAP